MYIVFLIFLILIIVVAYVYHDEVVYYIKPYFDKIRANRNEKINDKGHIGQFNKGREREREQEQQEPEGKGIVQSIKEVYKIPLNFLYKLCVTYGIFPISKKVDDLA